ncbi:MAG TPA: hypothetical protein VMU54_21315, partial [Planctomycetota bacterium]|nr:hypothetical protein [Planctomycetota bacterium]
MNDLDGYRRFIDGYASLGYALLFRKLGDFNQAQTALENALVRGHSNWLLERQDPRSCPAFMTKVAETLGTAEAPATAAPVTGLLATSQKLRALGDAVDQLRSFPGDDQVALVLLHVEEVPSEQILRWLGKNPAYLADLELRLKQKLLPGNSQGAASEEPVAFFLRALRQHRLSPQFPELVLQRLKKGLDIGAFPAPLLGWILVIGIPLFLGPLLTQHHGYYEYDYSPAWL